MHVQQRALKLLEQEAALAQADRTTFARQLIARAMGRLGMDRSPKAPPRKEFSALGKGKSLPLVRLDLKVDEGTKEWFRDQSNRMGGISTSAIFLFLLLNWCGINSLAQDSE